MCAKPEAGALGAHSLFFRLCLSAVPLLLLPFYTANTGSRAMGKDKTAAMERSKKAATGKGKRSGRGGSSSRSGLPPGWIQGDWIRSTIAAEELEELEEEGLIARGSWRVPEGKLEPRPREGECILLATHVD